MTACSDSVLAFAGPPHRGTYTDGTITIRVTNVEWKLDGSAIYGFDLEQVSGPPITSVIVHGGGRSFEFHRLHDLDTFVGEDGTHLPLIRWDVCYTTPATTTVPETSTVPESTTTTVVDTTTTEAPTTTWYVPKPYPECAADKPPGYEYPPHCPVPVTSTPTTVAPPRETCETRTDTAPSYDACTTTTAETTTTQVPTLPATGAASDAMAGTAAGLLLVGAFLVALAKRARA